MLPWPWATSHRTREWPSERSRDRKASFSAPTCWVTVRLKLRTVAMSTRSIP